MQENKKSVVIFGESQFARLAYVYLTEDSPYDVEAFTAHERYIRDRDLFGKNVIPFEIVTEVYPPDKFAMFVAVGYTRVNRLREEIYTQCKQNGYKLISYISSKAVHWNHIELGDNCFIYGAPVIQPFTKIGNDVVIGGASIGHDAIIEDHCYIASHAVIAGNVTLGAYSFVGINASIRDGLTVAPECIIGAGAVILRDTRRREVSPGVDSKPLAISSAELKSFQ
jgi:sugar O-acyltransferase (sialic acid O-acetyltransferase NeuD family)